MAQSACAFVLQIWVCFTEHLGHAAPFTRPGAGQRDGQMGARRICELRRPAACCAIATILCKEGSSASSQCSAASAAPACSTRDDGDAVDRRDGGHLAFGDRHATAVCPDATQLLRATDIDFSAFARRSALSFHHPHNSSTSAARLDTTSLSSVFRLNATQFLPAIGISFSATAHRRAPSFQPTISTSATRRLAATTSLASVLCLLDAIQRLPAVDIAFISLRPTSSTSTSSTSIACLAVTNSQSSTF